MITGHSGDEVPTPKETVVASIKLLKRMTMTKAGYLLQSLGKIFLILQTNLLLNSLLSWSVSL